MLACPMCGAAETDRLDIEGRRFLVFGCMFTPRVDAELSDREIDERLRAAIGSDPRKFFQGTCDALHVYVTKGEGAKWLTTPAPPRAGPSPGP